ncbi:DegT/DnrJ/EryC1/StrS family aminotransferase [Planktosalinus lacus]|uniref:Aminotransferase DegT n=1 Tax=Planktosalinus lacus TaxID=1526573 RepID=A0A8J2V8Q8_9FLAO|nr:DegT/DnrJ/EryC1/StrS family aminotransferase [Planktosalinus lacus]GGD84964.1 aminotransferase DegT [Planktosalinus lacus]
MITVTKTFLPPIEEYRAILQRAWDKQWLTNRGELVLELEGKLKTYLEVPNLTCTNNGTVPLQIALELLGKGGEIITTPFSYVATTAAIVWQHCTPVFVDIHPEYLTIDERLIEAAITPKTTAILATHVFGNPCAVEAIEAIAYKHGLKVIYDAAHAFGVSYKGESLFTYGDVSTCSFHATKLFHTGEGGCWITKNKELNDLMFYSHNFGHFKPEQYFDVGINAKMSELQAALGLAVLPYVDSLIEERKQIYDTYNSTINFNDKRRISLREGTYWNYSYYPIILKSEETLKQLMFNLTEKQINTRRYFYPSLNTLNYLQYKEMIVSEDISKRILCLPIYKGLAADEIELVVRIINNLKE